MPRPWIPLFIATTLAASPAWAGPIDLNTWTAESYPAVSGFGAGVWNVSVDGSSVTQTVNGQPTLFYSDFAAFNTTAIGTIRVSSTGGDDDFIGFVFGFDPGDTTDGSADYLLVDWKRLTQSFDFGSPSSDPGGTALAGLAVSRVTGVPSADEFWQHTTLSAGSSSSSCRISFRSTLTGSCRSVSPASSPTGAWASTTSRRPPSPTAPSRSNRYPRPCRNRPRSPCSALASRRSA